MKELIEKATTKTGLKVFACDFNKVYETGKVVEGFNESMRIAFGNHLEQWNYVAVPEMLQQKLLKLVYLFTFPDKKTAL